MKDSKSTIPVSVLVPTWNEESNLEACLSCLSSFDEVIVLDSMSTDRTEEIARSFGATVIQRVFDNFSAHKNWAISNIPFRHEWILIIDADERVEKDLVEEIGRVVGVNDPSVDGYYIARKNIFDGVWIRYGGWYPDFQMRLFRRTRARYESRIVHEHVLLDGQEGYLKNSLLHHDSKGLERYFGRHNTYSSMEAVEAYRALRNPESSFGQIRPSVFSRGPKRRRYLKLLAYRYLPFRSFFKFLWMYIFRLGFLDGRVGFRFCLLHAFYEYQVSLKLRELDDPDSPLRGKYRDYIGD